MTYAMEYVPGSTGNRGNGNCQISCPLWQMVFEDIKFTALPTPFRHLGFFPEQSPNCNGQQKKLRPSQKNQSCSKLLNLFAYSGVADLYAAAAGAEVTHLDASKKAVALAFDNRSLSGLEKAPVKFITDDVLHFVAREQQRGNHYEGILLDPPKYGQGQRGSLANQ